MTERFDETADLVIVDSEDGPNEKSEPATSSKMSGDRGSRRAGRRPGRRASKMDVRAKLERSRQSARECRARKKLRYQYLEDLVANREKAVFALRDELELYKQWCIQVDEGLVPLALLRLAEGVPESTDSEAADVQDLVSRVDSAARPDTQEVPETFFGTQHPQISHGAGKKPRTDNLVVPSGRLVRKQSEESVAAATGSSSDLATIDVNCLQTFMVGAGSHSTRKGSNGNTKQSGTVQTPFESLFSSAVASQSNRESSSPFLPTILEEEEERKIPT